MEKRFGVAVKAVIKYDKKFLIIKKSNIEDVNPNTYDIPGGRLEFGEQPENALLREVREEIGLDVSILKPIRTWTFTKDEEFQLVGITFLCVSESDKIILSDEHTDAVWLSAEEINNKDDFPGWLKQEIKSAIKRE